MPSTYSPNLRIELIANGEQSGTWGTTTNTNLGTLIEDAISGYVSVSITSANQALTALNGTADQSRNMTVNLTTTTTANFSVYIPPADKVYIIRNSSSYDATVYCSTVLGNTTAAGTGVTIPAGRETLVFADGTNVALGIDYLGSLALGTALPITSGGTGATTASGARTNLGATTVGANLFTLANPSAITFIRVNADNTVSTLDAATFRTAIGAGTGNGSVTSITAGTYLTGGTITTSGTLAVDATSANTASKVVARDASGNFSAGTITATLNGNASTATSATSATTASTANALNTGNNYRMNSLGVGAAATGTAGEIVATGDVTAYYSDDRLKTKLGKIENALDKLCALDGFYYEANETAQSLGYEAKREVGVSAQQMKEILPEIVAPAPIDAQYMTVRYERALPLIVEAIKELRAEVEALKKGS
jgi:hypothetical protein